MLSLDWSNESASQAIKTIHSEDFSEHGPALLHHTSTVYALAESGRGGLICVAFALERGARIRMDVQTKTWWFAFNKGTANQRIVKVPSRECLGRDACC